MKLQFKYLHVLIVGIKDDFEIQLNKYSEQGYTVQGEIHLELTRFGHKYHLLMVQKIAIFPDENYGTQEINDVSVDQINIDFENKNK